jgi:type I restriction enzyme S subunit
MMSDWKKVKLDDVAELCTSKVAIAELSKNNYISTNNMLNDIGGVETSDGLPSAKTVNKFLKGDVLFSNIRTYFKKVWLAAFDGGCSADVLVWRSLDSNVLTQSYLFYILSSDRFTEYSVKTSKGVKMPRGDKQALFEFEFELPPLDIQLQITEAIQPLSFKIENNSKMNQTLEKIAQRIFKSWFIDFDPVKANAEGLPFAGLSPDIQSLFPSEFIESEMGLIPKGWEVKPLSNAILLQGGGTPKRSVAEYWGGHINWFSVQDVPKEGDVFVVETKDKITTAGLKGSSTKILDPGSTIITARGTVGKLAMVSNPMCMNQSCYGVKGNDRGDIFTYYLLKKTIKELQSKAHGGVFDTITTKTFDSVLTCLPPNSLDKEFTNVCISIFSKIESNVRQTVTLNALRDRLLPKLLSGSIEINQKLDEAS